MYRLKSNFDGTWDIETEVESIRHYNDPSEMDSNGYYLTKTFWQVRAFDSKLTYARAKERVERRIAEAAFVPIILTPPFPDRDPTLPPRKRFLGIF